MKTKKPELTPWFPPHIKPVHVGVWDVADGSHFRAPWFKKWDGRYWYTGGRTVSEANRVTEYSILEEFSWRGLARKPK